MDSERRGWHLEKNVSIGHIITTFSVAVSMLIWATTVEKRVSLLEATTPVLMRADDRQEESRRELVNALREDLRVINAKLDRLSERKP